MPCFTVQVSIVIRTSFTISSISCTKTVILRTPPPPTLGLYAARSTVIQHMTVNFSRPERPHVAKDFVTPFVLLGEGGKWAPSPPKYIQLRGPPLPATPI